MANVLPAELLKLRKRPATWIIVGVWLAMNLAFGYLIPYLIYRSGSFPGPDGAAASGQLLAAVLPAGLVTNVLSGYPLFGGALVLILGALMIGGEYGFGTLKTLLTQRPRRLEVLGGALAALAVGLSLVWVLVIENLIRGFAALLDVFDTVQRALPGVNAGSLVAALGTAGQGDGSGGTPGVEAVVGGTQAVVVLACYAIGFILVAGLLLTRRDVT